MSEDFAKRTHLDWLGYTQPVGVVVSATALVEAGVALPTDLIELSREFEKTNPTFRDIAINFLGWRESDLQPAPESMTTLVTGYDDVMHPTYVVADLLLVQELTEEKTAVSMKPAWASSCRRPRAQVLPSKRKRKRARL
ncbi:MAG: hypothetical protein M3Y72_25005 [Acidobacteriota bacterium]|nr:hypothetical protein [Acidobacteriota bacterium]